MKAGLAQYFESIWNWIDSSQFVFYLIYFMIRMVTSSTCYIPDKETATDIEEIKDEK